MIEEYLITYGPLGAWTIWLIYEKQKLLSELRASIEANTCVLRDVCNFLKGGR